MTKRGRKSVAELTIVQGDFAKGRPPPPEDLNDRQSAIWREITETQPDEFFATAALRGMLADLCRHRDSAEQLSQVLSSFDAEWLKTEAGAERYGMLARMRALETRSAASLATKLRLTNQARYTTQRAGNAQREAQTGSRPWEA